MTKKPSDEYLGDGVYASHDGWQIWLAANHHENRVVALEPHTFKSLLEYASADPRFAEALRTFSSREVAT
jgi:hypothetical protein